MSLLDSLIGQMMGQFEAQVLPGLLQQALAHTSLGSLQGLVDKLRSSGLGAQVDSWLGRGANQPVTAEQLENALGPKIVEKMSTTLNMPPDQIFGFLAKWLPTIIDALSPSGKLQTPPAK